MSETLLEDQAKMSTPCVTLRFGNCFCTWEDVSPRFMCSGDCLERFVLAIATTCPSPVSWGEGEAQQQWQHLLLAG